MLDRVLRPLFERALARAGAVLAPRIAANHLTVAGFGSGIVAAILIVADFAPVALAFLLFGRVADGLDGAVARVRGPTALGAFLDTLLDLIVYAALPVAFAIRTPASGLAAAFMLFGFVSMMTLELSLRFWTRQVSEAPAPLVGHTETFIVFAIACVHPPAFAILAYIYGTACFIAAGVQLAAAVAQIDSGKP